MKRTRRNRISRSRKGQTLARWGFLVVAILALGIQSFVVKPHIHLQAEKTLYAALTLDSVNGGELTWDSDEERAEALDAALKHGGHPLQHDASDCVYCQAAHQSGQFLTPGAALDALPVFANVRVIETETSSSSERPVSFAWQGRAPPLI